MKIFIIDKSAEVPNNRNAKQNTVFVANVFTLLSDIGMHQMPVV